MLADAQAGIPTHAWELLLVAALLVIAVLSFRLLGAGLGRALATPSFAAGAYPATA
ncbi:MAG: hypothetical protein P4M09_31350 [Devosia sp.]|nr:hypothetical protein [Devosia sp.]